MMTNAKVGQSSALSEDEAYAVQREAAARRCQAGDSVIGYKIGCIGPAIVTQFGMSGPIRGRLFHSERRISGDIVDCTAVNLAIEGEMAIEFGDRAAHPVIELHDFVFQGAQKTLSELIARNGLNIGVVLPAPAGVKSLENWPASAVLTILVNGAVIDSGRLWAFAGGAVEAAGWLGLSLAAEGLSLKPGDLALTGTPLGLHTVQAGDHVAVAIDGEVYVTCDIAQR